MKRYLKIFLLLTLLFFVLPLGAQEMKRVTGHILDKTSGKPIDLKQVSVNI